MGMCTMAQAKKCKTCKYTASEVATHNTEKSAWIIYKKKIYDVTKFLPEHPGGSSAILRYAGKDATRIFDAYHGKSEKKMLAKYRVGKLTK
eukprot:jgi/Picsp_1/3021/NSC_01243-R1_cyt-b5-pb